jgi:hypothetical protein
MQATGRTNMIPKRTRKYEIDITGPEVKTTIDYMHDCIRKCIANQYQVIQPAKSATKAKNTLAYNTLLARASQMPKRRWPKRRWWNADHQADVLDAFDVQVRHIEEKWLAPEYCKFSRPWFTAEFIDKVRGLKEQGQEWVHLFDQVPDALTDDEEEVGNAGSDAKSEMDVANGSGGSNVDGAESVPDAENAADPDEDSQSDQQSIEISSSSDVESDAVSEVTSQSKAVGHRNRYSVSSRRRGRRPRRSSGDADESQSQEDEGSDTQGYGGQLPASRRRSKGWSTARNRKFRRRETGFYTLQTKYGRQG